MSEESRKDWERPWTSEEIVEHADYWNLACDAALLNTLKAFGEKILKKAEDVNVKIENLNENLSKIHLQVDLARNEFSSLRNTQFVECRVYEDDETILPEKLKVEGENNVPEEETIEDFREVVALGLEILDEFYDKVNVTVSDSEGEDEEGPSYVFRRKDPFINRRLPFIIGTEEWHKKWHVGLEETDSENENSSEKSSDSENEDSFSQQKDQSDVSSEFSNLSGLNNSKVKPVVVPTTSVTKQDLQASASASDTSAEPTPPRTLSFAEQLAAKLGNVIKEAGTSPVQEPEVNKRPIQKKHSDFGALFSNEPPPLDDMQAKESHGIFSGGKGLFDDDDEDDLWNPGKAIISSGKQFSTNERKTDEVDKLNQGKGLFDDDSDDGIFRASESYGIAQPNKQPYLQTNKPAVPVFDEEPPLFEEDTNTKEKRKPTGGVSLFGKTDLFHGQNIEKLLKQRKASSSDDSNQDEPEFPAKPTTKSTDTNVIKAGKTTTKENTQNEIPNKQTISSVPQNKVSQEKKSTLFDDDIFGDDLFSSTAKESSSDLFEKSILFSDDDTVEPFLPSNISVNEKTLKSSNKSDTSKDFQSNDLLSPETPDTEYSFRKNSKSNINTLFDDSRNDEDNFFMAKNRKDIPKTDYIEKEIKEKPYSDKSSTKPKLNLFEDDLDDVDDLFSGISGKKVDKNKKESKSFLFDNDEDDDFNIFMTKSDNKSTEIVGKADTAIKTGKTSTKIRDFSESEQMNKSTKPKISLFDDVLDDMDDLFSQFSKKSDKNENLKSEKPSELFSESLSSQIIMAQKNTGDTNEKTSSETKQEKVSDELENLEREKMPISAAETIIKNASSVKPITAKKPVEYEDSSQKPAIMKNPDIQNDSIEKVATQKPDSWQEAVGVQKPAIINDLVEKDVPTLKDITIDPMKKSKTEGDPVNEVDNSNHNISTEGVKKVDAPVESKIIKKGDEAEERENQKEDKHAAVPKISIIEEPKDIEKNVDLFPDMGPPKTETYKNSLNVLNVNFMDSMPPPDDDWDTYSDNTFDDMEPGNDDFQSQPSSLFDREPPSLFFDDSCAISRDPSDDRLSSATSLSEKNSPDVFGISSFASDKRQAQGFPKNDSNISDRLDIRSGKNADVQVSESESSAVPQGREKWNKSLEEDERQNSNIEGDISKVNEEDLSSQFSQEPKHERYSIYKDKTQSEIQIPEQKYDSANKNETSSLFEIPAAPDFIEENSNSLFGDVLDEDQTDFLSSNKKQTNNDGENLKISENIISDKSNKKRVSFDEVDESQISTDELGGTDIDDNMQSNITKITEKLQQITNKNEEKTKPLVIPKKLTHNLNINVGALLPGSALPRREKTQSPDENEKLSKSLPASRFSLNEDFGRTKPIPILRVSSEDTPTKTDYKLEKSASFDGGTDVEVLQSITKDRVRIPVKRRPSSRRARQKSLRDSISDFRLDDPIPDEETPSEPNESFEADDSTSVQIPQNQRVAVEPLEQKILGKDNLPTKISEKASKAINILEDESEDLFKIIEKDIKNVNKANVIRTKKKELFVDEIEEFFGETSTIRTQKMDSLFQDENDLFGNLRYASEGNHESRGVVRGESANKILEVHSEHNKDRLIVSNDNEKYISNDFLRSVENNSRSKTFSTKKLKPPNKTTIDNLFDSSDEDDIFKSMKVTTKETKTKKDLREKDDTSISIIGRIASKTEDKNLKVEGGRSKPDSLFNFSDDDEDFLEKFTSGKNDEKTKDKNSSEKLRSNSLFDDMDDDDIFGTKSTENKTKQDVKPSVINKKPPKSTSLRKLENIEGEEDPLSALLK